jgi:hypothetical protein
VADPASVPTVMPMRTLCLPIKIIGEPGLVSQVPSGILMVRLVHCYKFRARSWVTVMGICWEIELTA